jgi:hypothetical protein
VGRLRDGLRFFVYVGYPCLRKPCVLKFVCRFCSPIREDKVNVTEHYVLSERRLVHITNVRHKDYHRRYSSA